MAPTTSVPPATRDEWMTLAPVSGDWSTRVDPTKLKGRKFQTGKGAKAPSQAGTGGDASWHENPEQKQERLKREVLGIKDTSTSTASSRPAPAHNAHDDATARRLKEYSVRLNQLSMCLFHLFNPRHFSVYLSDSPARPRDPDCIAYS